MEESDALVVIAEVAVAIAGFSGIATALEARQDGMGWSESRRVRFVYMLSQSAIALFAALLTLVSLYRVPEGAPLDRLWVVSSVYWAGFASIGNFMGWKRGRHLPTPGGIERFVTPVVLFGFAVLILTQIYNIFWLREFWPFMLGLVGNLAFAFLQFTRIVIPENTRNGGESASD